MSNLVLGIYVGNYWEKTAEIYGDVRFCTASYDWYQQEFIERFGEDDIGRRVGVCCGARRYL